MKKWNFLTIWLVLWVFELNAQTKPGVLSPGMGAYSGRETEVFSFVMNTAALVHQHTISAGMYAERPYMLPGLKNILVAVAAPTAIGNFGMSSSMFGNPEYSQNSFGLAYARTMGAKLDIGIQFNRNSIRANGYGAVSVITADAGLLLYFSEKFHGGIQLKNPAGGRFGAEDNEKFPRILSFGIGLDASSSLFISGVIIKEEGKPPNVNCALQYRLHSKVSVRAGCSTAGAIPWLSALYKFNQLQFGISLAAHQRLGITPGLFFMYNFKNTNVGKEEE